MEIKPIICANCGGQIEIEEGKQISTCPFCGTQLYFDDGSTTINLNQNIRDEARLNELRLQERQLEFERDRYLNEIKERKRMGRAILFVGLGLILAAIIFLIISSAWKPTIVLSIFLVICAGCGIPLAINGGKMMTDNRTYAERNSDRLEEQRRKDELARLRIEEERLQGERAEQAAQRRKDEQARHIDEMERRNRYRNERNERIQRMNDEHARRREERQQRYNRR